MTRPSSDCLVPQCLHLAAPPSTISKVLPPLEIYKIASGDDLWIYRFDPSDHDASKDKQPRVRSSLVAGWNGDR